MDNQNLQANEDFVSMPQNKKILQANEDFVSMPQNKKILQANEDFVSMPQNKKILQANEKNPETNLFKVFICHRLPERTFKIRNHYFPVCSRCTGIYIGAFSYYIFVYFVYVQYNIAVILAAILMVLPTFSDGLTQFFGFRKSSNVLRFSTGLIAGIGLGVLVKSIKWILLS